MKVLDLYLWESIVEIMKLIKDEWRGKKAMEIKMGCSLMILHILDFWLSGELAKAMVEIFSLDK
jgi:hypothetical protein